MFIHKKDNINLQFKTTQMHSSQNRRNNYEFKFYSENLKLQDNSTQEHKSSQKKKLSINKEYIQKTFSDFTEDSSNSIEKGIEDKLVPSNRKFLINN